MSTNYGVDMSCGADLDPLLRDVTGETLMRQAIVRRWITPPGMLIDDEDYGFGLMELLSEEMQPGDLARIAARLQVETIKDERVISAAVTVVADPDREDGYLISARCLGGEGPFAFTLAVDGITVEFLNGG